jgi:hypothetical protein
MVKKNSPSGWETDVLNGQLMMVEEIESAVASHDVVSLAQLSSFLSERKSAIELRRAELLVARSSDVVAHLLDDETPSESTNEPTENKSMPLTYTELRNEMEERYPEPSTVVLEKQDVSTRRAWAVLDALNDRGGFDDWFENIDDDIQDEIFDAIRTATQVE